MGYSSSDSLEHHSTRHGHGHRHHHNGRQYHDSGGLASTPKLSSISGAKTETSSIDASARTSSSPEEVDRSGELSVSVSNASDQEREWVEEDEPGVYITIRELPGGIRELRRVRFRKHQEEEGEAGFFLPSTSEGRRSKAAGGRIFRMFKLLPMLTSGCKMVELLGRPSKALLSDKASTITLFGYRRGRVSLAIQEDPRSPPVFLIELPMLTSSLHKEMASGLVKIALESETRTHKKKLMEEYVWAVYCNGRKSGYSIRRKQTSDEERHVMQLLRGVSMGAGVLPCDKEAAEGELTYMRARFERVVGSKDSEALYMINPDGTGGPELSIFLVRVK